MINYIGRRVLQSMLLLGAVMVISFFLLYLTGDPVSLMAPPSATPEQIEAMRVSLGYDKPLLEQFAAYMGNLARGDMGESLQYKEPVLMLIMDQLPNTLLLSGVSIAVSMIAGIALGIGAAANRRGIVDFLSLILSTLGQAIPVFWLGILLINLFAVRLGWLPVSGFLTPQSIILPALTLGLYSSSRVTRLVRSEILQDMGKNYVLIARAKGLSKSAVMLKHVFRSSAITVVTLIGLEMNSLLGGAVVTETVFAWPGLGRLLVASVVARDFPLTRACILVICVLFLLINLIVDLLYGLLDPRISYKAGRKR